MSFRRKVVFRTKGRQAPRVTGQVILLEQGNFQIVVAEEESVAKRATRNSEKRQPTNGGALLNAYQAVQRAELLSCCTKNVDTRGNGAGSENRKLRINQSITEDKLHE